MSAHFHELKGQMNKMREKSHRNLTKLTLQSTTCLAELKKRADAGELMLRLAENARKLETEEEKVLPFYASSLTNEEQEDVAAAVAEPPTENLASVRFHACSCTRIRISVNWRFPVGDVQVRLARELLEALQQGSSRQVRAGQGEGHVDAREHAVAHAPQAVLGRHLGQRRNPVAGQPALRRQQPNQPAVSPRIQVPQSK